MTDSSQVIGATAGEDESGLLHAHLAPKAARNAAELETIDRAYEKHLFRSRRKSSDGSWLTDAFIRRVHHDMFGEIWDWAGKYRTVSLNIGMAPHQIPEQVKLLCDDFVHWNASSMTILELAARLQNRLTKIHPFRNGNGRHARLITDIFFYSRKHRLPQWPQIQLLDQGDDVRKDYINAQRKADAGDFSELMGFIESCIKK